MLSLEAEELQQQRNHVRAPLLSAKNRKLRMQWEQAPRLDSPRPEKRSLA